MAGRTGRTSARHAALPHQPPPAAANREPVARRATRGGLPSPPLRRPPAQAATDGAAFPAYLIPSYPKGNVMRTHWLRCLTSLVAAAIVTLSGTSLSTAGAGFTAAGPICPQGTHWDNVLHTCV